MSEFKVASVFSSHMVLQRNKPIAVFGEGEDGKIVKAVLSFNKNGNKESTLASSTVSGGKWILYLPESDAMTNCTMTVSCGENSKTFENIAIGEVWLCGGQSNMEFELQNMTGGKKHLEEDNPDVRFYYTQKNGFMDETFFTNEAMMGWKEFDGESAKCWSAVGYLFGKQLSEALGVTVGLIGCNWGGTSASAWMSEEYLASDEDTNTYLEDYRKQTEGKSIEQQIKEYDDYLVYEAEWNEKCNECYRTNPSISWDEVQKIAGPCRWPGPMGCKNPFRPNGLYQTMINRVTPYSIRGWLYYQGESDDHKPAYYYKLMKLLINQWRHDWNDADMPFFFVQLPGHQYAADPDYKHWCIIREAQAKIADTVKNTGMAVIIDAGEFNEIHPKDKVPVADRLYRQAMNRVYGQMSDKEAQSPVYDSFKVDGNKIYVSFRYAEDGFEVRKTPDGKEVITGFELAGADKVYYPADAAIEGSGIRLSSKQVSEPVSVRYLWTNYPKDGVTLYSKYGLPVAPFRSCADEEEITSHETEIKQVMEL
ncbi:MAG: sialate O-acetylesterase [Lachnospiraceae bacterium]